MKNDERLITIADANVFLTHNAEDAYHIIKGCARIFIVPWDSDKEQSGRRASLGEVEEGNVIPAFSFRDSNTDDWRFAIVSKEGELIIKELSGCNTKVLKSKFLKKMGIETFAAEGYELSLREFYRIMTLKEDIYDQRVKKQEPKVQRAASAAIKSALIPDEHEPSSLHGSELYQILSFACKNNGIAIESEANMLRLYGKEYTIKDIARHSHFICREVILDDKWYQNDCGTLIVYIDGHPTAAIPNRKNQYYIYRAGTNDRSKVLATNILDKIEPVAISIGRTLPSDAISKKDIIKFCCKGIHRTDIIRLVILSIIIALIGVLLPTITRYIYDEYIPIGNYNMLVQTGLLIISFMVGNLLFSVVKNLCELCISSRIGYELQNAIIYRAFQMPLEVYCEYDNADLAQRITQISSVTLSFISRVLSISISTLIGLAYFIRMCTYSGKLSIEAILILVGYALIMLTTNHFQLSYEQSIAENGAESDSRLLQYICAVDKIRMAGAENRALLKFMYPYADKQRDEIKKARISSFANQIKEIIPYLISIFFYYTITKRNIGLSVGAFIAFNTAFGSLSSHFIRTVSELLEIIKMRVIFKRLSCLMNAPIEGIDDKEYITDLNGNIKIEHVSFSYPSSASNVLNDISFKIDAGEYIAIVGPSGCGKSTLMSLLLGFNIPTKGKIYYDDRDIETLNLHSLRRKIGVVLQKGGLISGSIYENITISADHPSLTEVDEIIEKVGLKDDIDQMPMGLQTVLNGAGGTISGGQQQRILIARALINHPRILLLDEATSALDNITQAKVCDNLDQLKITRLVIAHRLSTVKNCDRILVMQNGTVVENGSYQALMEQKGLFFQMATRQLVE